MTRQIPATTPRRRRAAAALGLTGALMLTGTAIAGTASAQSLPFGSLDSGSAAESVAPTPRLASIDNFRDIAGSGDGYTGFAGLHVNRGVFYRSNALRPNPTDLATLNTLGLTAIYDLRTDGEIAKAPDEVIDGARYKQISVLDADPSAIAVQTVEEARTLMREGYEHQVHDATARRGYAELLTDLADTDGPQVFHCTAGKDRTGWSTALLLGIAGVSRQTILDDYVLTNEYSAAAIDAKVAYLETQVGPVMAAAYRELLSVDASYLEASFAVVDRDFDSFERYLTDPDGLGLSPLTVMKLRLKLLS